MENQDIQRTLVKSSDIESRLIILKRRAAEADFLREERDMLISRLKLYNPDYVWPDSGINKCLNLPIGKEFEEIQKRNETLKSENEELTELKKRLMSENDDLKGFIQTLKKELEEMKEAISKLEALTKENEQLKINLEEMDSLKNEKYMLSVEKEQLKDDLNKLLNIDSNEPEKGCKTLLKQLYIRVNKTTDQYNNLLDELWSKEVQIDVLTGKITQLNAKLNEPYISAKIKLSMGKNLSDEEAYMWAVYNLETTNKKMNCELQKVTEQLNQVTEKYIKIKDELRPVQSVNRGMVSAHELEEELRKLEEENYNLFMKDVDDASIIYEQSDKGSTAPVSRDASRESMFHPLAVSISFNKVEILRENAYYLEEVYVKLMKIKLQMKRSRVETRQRLQSRVQDVNVRASVLRVL
ncbi:unnamed protein product [Nezara viridula]|uniref:Uncharacterized protein n=1 Tax=Nezara viridula TaxID=85310 RepID=A0A9P0E052_NEZVI|nr:unnamed protein product [Nezara viridula]